MKTLARFLAVGAVVILIVSVFLGISITSALAQTEPPQKGPEASESSSTWALAIGAAVAVSAGSLGAAFAVGKVGAAALGAASEKPELLGRSLVFVGLAEGVAIYGLIIAIMLLGKI